MLSLRCVRRSTLSWQREPQT
uniref:Uncharacterized protein n=1 Tax=Anguilla anguilla TaxID=7936 RepID=A0A0E9SFF1_ANGAN